MFIAMNRFKIMPGKELDFEEIWRNRDTHLKNVDGFREFRLIKGAAGEDHTLYASHTIWESEEYFESWTKSEAFRDAHKNAGQHSNLYLGHPIFEGFEVVDGI
ncbi:antibiotic biosynthesis monooxygenase [SAR116 cluster bacterium]|nr:antibiotic biosynthesis monooxygenase [SAR116 cluster bacterium]